MSRNKMRRITYLLILAFVMIAPFQAVAILGVEDWGKKGESDGVYCEINKVKLFAQSAADCEKAGGVVTHTIRTTVTVVKPKK